MTLAVNPEQSQDQSAVMVSLIQRAATDPAFDLEKLDRLLDVKERWEREEARKAYVAALAAFKLNPPRLVKDRRVDFGEGRNRTRYNHASLGDVASLIAAGLAQHGLSHGWAVAQAEGVVTVTCTLTHALGHSEQVAITGPRDDSGNKNGIQAIGSAVTYLERYTLTAITGLAAHDIPTTTARGLVTRPSHPQQQRRQEPQTATEAPPAVREPSDRLATRCGRCGILLPEELGRADVRGHVFSKLKFTVSDGETVFGHGHVKDWLSADSVNTWTHGCRAGAGLRHRAGIRHDGHRHARRGGSWVCRGVPATTGKRLLRPTYGRRFPTWEGGGWVHGLLPRPNAGWT